MPQALRASAGKGLLGCILGISIASLVGVVPAWLLLLALPMTVGWLGMGLLERIPLKPTADPGQTVQRMNQASERLTRSRRRLRILLALELAALVFLAVLRVTGNLTPLARFP